VGVDWANIGGWGAFALLAVFAIGLGWRMMERRINEVRASADDKVQRERDISDKWERVATTQAERGAHMERSLDRILDLLGAPKSTDGGAPDA
jgi:hypothetical protein